MHKQGEPLKKQGGQPDSKGYNRAVVLNLG